MKRLPLVSRFMMLARAIGNPSNLGGQTIFDNMPAALVCDNNGILWVRTAQPVSGGTNVQKGAVPATVSASSSPGAGVQASASLPADGSGLGAKNVLIRVSWSMGDTAAVAGGTFKVVVRDGASGVGTILWQKEIGPLPANSFVEGSEVWPLGGGIPGSATTAMTVEFTAAPAGTGFQSVAITGYLST